MKTNYEKQNSYSYEIATTMKLNDINITEI